MAREKRQLHTQKSSKPMWPWVLGGVLVLGVGIGLGVLFSDGHKGEPGSIGPIAKNEKEGQNGNFEEALAGNGDSDGGDVDLPKGKGDGVAGSNSGLFEFIKKNRVYLVPTAAGQSRIAEDDSRLKNPPLGTFFKALKEHNKANFAKKENPDPFEAVTWANGPDPMGLKADTPVRYDSAGGTQAKPLQYDLGPMTALASSLNPASKAAGIYFQFPKQRQWFHIQGKDIESFYLVPVETGRYPALVTMKVAEAIEFDDGTLTTKVDAKISMAVRKLLKDNKTSDKIMLRAGASLAQWGLAYVNTEETIDFKKVHLEPKIAAANSKVKQLTHFVTWTDNALKDLFPVAQRVADARAQVKADKRNDPKKKAEVARQTAAYAKIITIYLTKGSPVPGLDAHKANLAKEAGQILLGKTNIAAAKKTWEQRKKNLPKAAKAELSKWESKNHQQAEWGRFKKHQMFYLGGSMGVDGAAVVPLVQFTNK